MTPLSTGEMNHEPMILPRFERMEDKLAKLIDCQLA